MASPGRALEPEALTRKIRIDAALRAAGWQIVPHSPGTPFNAYHSCAVTEFPTANGPADYVLIANNRILAVVEAKRIGLSIQEVLTQAQRHARGIQQVGLQFGEYGVLFLFSNNCESFRLLGVRDESNTGHDLTHFRTSEAIRNKVLGYPRVSKSAEPPRGRRVDGQLDRINNEKLT